MSHFSEPCGVERCERLRGARRPLPDVLIADEPKGLIRKLRWRLRRWHLRLRYGSRVKTFTEAFGSPQMIPSVLIQPGFLERAFKEHGGVQRVVHVTGASAPCSKCGSTDYNGFSVTWRDGQQVVIGRCCGGCD